MGRDEDITTRTQVARLEERVAAATAQFVSHDAQDAKRFDAIDKALEQLRETITANRVAVATITATLASVGALLGSLVSHFLFGGH